MALNPAFVGRTYPASPPYLVGREKVREFATAVGEDSPACHDLAAAAELGYADLVAPTTFPFVIVSKAMAAALFDPELGLDYSRVVHGEQSFSYARPLLAGDEVTVTISIEAIRSAAGNDLITVRGDVTTVTGDPVCTARSITVARGTAEPEAAR